MNASVRSQLLAGDEHTPHTHTHTHNDQLINIHPFQVRRKNK